MKPPTQDTVNTTIARFRDLGSVYPPMELKIYPPATAPNTGPVTAATAK